MKKLVQYGVSNLSGEEFFKLKSEFDFVKENGIKLVSKSFLMLYISPLTEGRLKIGVICGRKFDKRAVVRNRVRRIFKESFRLVKSQLVASSILFIPRKGAEKKRAQEIQQELIEAFQRTKIWKEIPTV